MNFSRRAHAGLAAVMVVALTAIVGAVGLAVLALSSRPAMALQPGPDEFILAPDFEPNRGWINTDRPLDLHEDLKGHVVLLDFWTYCCINCLHVLPDLEYLEEKYKDEPFVVVGVHSAKFDTEAERRSIRHAVQRYDIKHPVVVDDNFGIWRSFGARAWPTFAIVDPEGNLLGTTAGEGKRDLLDSVIAQTLETHREKGTLAETKIEIRPDDVFISPSALRYPGKVLAHVGDSPADSRLFVADSSNDRVIIATLPDEGGRAEVIDVYGNGERGLVDGSIETVRFHDPQGFVFDADENLLYVADTKNHVIRMIDLGRRTVRTIVGTGEQGYDRRGGKPGLEQKLGSPWALALSPGKQTLYIAMAGTHQLWATDLSDGDRRTRAIAGSGAENVYDGAASLAALAQPSGFALSEDGRRLYFTDTEGSAIRVYDTDEKTVETIIGRAVSDPLADTSLFDFGDIDGVYPVARLQKAVGITLFPGEDGRERLLIADTYNDTLKVIDPAEKRVTSWLGLGRNEDGPDDALRLLEPAGLTFSGGEELGRVIVADTNHHRLVEIDAKTREWREIVLDGLEPVGRGAASAVPAVQHVRVSASRPASGEVDLRLAPVLPEGAKVNLEIPVAVRVSGRTAAGTVEPVLQRTLSAREDPLPKTLGVDATGFDALVVELSFAWCTDDESLCIPVDLAWEVGFDVESAGADVIELSARVPGLEP
ncbi:MAG: thioredoxin-like domain-containing protein [Planctomycetota bacterium]